MNEEAWSRYEDFRVSYNKFVEFLKHDKDQIILLNELLKKKENFVLALAKKTDTLLTP